jgi:Na+-transporting NADH:ubiquinone oxidoreductase subunit B
MSLVNPPAISTRPPFLYLGWVPARVTWAQVAALVSPVIAATALRGPGMVATIGAALIAAIFWESLFALVRRRTLTAHGLTTALIVAVMVPATVPLWQVALAVTMGVVLAELVFGGRGFGFLSAAVASLAILIFSFPGVVLAGGEPWIAAASLPGAAWLLVIGLISWRVLLAAGTVFVVAALAQGEALVLMTTGGALIFSLVFLACDPLGAASTNPGRWLYGGLTGGLIALFGAGSGPAISANAVVFAVLLASIFAPLLDQLVILQNARRRSQRAGRPHD